MNTINDTTRCYPRTLREIDPVLYRASIEYFPNHSAKADKAVMWACFVGFIVFILAVSFGAQP